MAEDVEAKAREIAREARQVRKPLPRWLWTAAIVVGAACIGGFVKIMLADGGTPTTPPHQASGSPGFASGALIGAFLGFVIGWAIARQRAAHSSRNKP